MATLESIVEAVQVSLQDNVFTTDKLTKLANQGIQYCSKRVLLPKLEVSGLIDTTLATYETIIPDSWLFDRNLYACFCADNNISIQVLNSIDNLMTFYPDYKTDLQEGNIKYVVVRGNYLTYYPIPAEVIALDCNFYTQHTPLVNDSDIPYCLPYGTHEELLENFILWRAWSDLEDGLEGPKVNTQYYRELFMIAFDDLDSMIDTGQSRCRPVIENGWI